MRSMHYVVPTTPESICTFGSWRVYTTRVALRRVVSRGTDPALSVFELAADP